MTQRNWHFVGQSVVEMDVHNDEFSSRTSWHSSVTEEAQPSRPPTGSLTEEVTLEQGSEE